MKKNCRIKSFDEYLLNVNVYEAQKPVGNIVIIHGLAEHQGRYEEFAEYLTIKHFNVLTYDLRGHGLEERYDNLGFFAKEKGIRRLIADLKLLIDRMNEDYPNLKCSVIGHGIGGILACIYLRKYDYLLNNLVLISPPVPNKRTFWALKGAELMTILFGAKGRSKLLARLVFKQKSNEWLSYNHENIKCYTDDKYCGFKITNGCYRDVFKMICELKNNNNYLAKNRNLKIIAMNGEDDPLMKDASFSKIFKCLKYSGYGNFEQLSYPGMKHEILHEDNRIQVFEDIISRLK